MFFTKFIFLTKLRNYYFKRFIILHLFYIIYYIRIEFIFIWKAIYELWTLCLAISHYLSHLAHHLLILLVKSHLQLYPCPLQINYLWNLGFLLGISIIIQIITGIFLGLHYTSDLNSAYYSIFFFIREIYYGWYLRYFHSNGASFIFIFLFIHIGRAIYYGSYFPSV